MEIVETTFAERFAYACLIRHYRAGKAPTNAEIGRAVQRTGQWVLKWSEATEAPTDYRVHAPLAEYLGVDRQWLIEGKGPAPEPGFWAGWLELHRKGSGHERVAEATPLPYHGRTVSSHVQQRAAAKKAGKKRRGNH